MRQLRMEPATKQTLPVAKAPEKSSVKQARLEVERITPSAKPAEKSTVQTVKQTRIDPEKEGTPATKSATAEEQALLLTLRTESKEDARRRAALELGKTGTRSFDVLRTLNIVISGGEQDGHRRETSPRVKEAALAALQQCLAGQRTVAPRQVPSPTPPPARTARASTATRVEPPTPLRLPEPTASSPAQPHPSDVTLPMPPPLLSANPFRAID